MQNQNENGRATATQLLSLLNPAQQIDLRQYWFILWRRKWWVVLPSFLITCGSIVYALMYIRPIFEASATVQVAPGRLLNRSVQQVTPGASGGVDYTELRRRILSTNYLLQLARRLDSIKDEGAVKAAQSLQLRAPSVSSDELLERIVVENLRKKISVGLIPGTQLFQISARDQSPQMAYHIVKTLTEVFIDESKKNELRGIRGVREFSNEQLAIYEAKMHEAEEKLMRFIERSTSSQTKPVGTGGQNIPKLQELITSSEIAISQKERRLSELQMQLPASSIKLLWDENPDLAQVKIRIDDKLENFKKTASMTSVLSDYEIMFNNDINVLHQDCQRLLARLIPRLYSELDDEKQRALLQHQLAQIDLYILRTLVQIANDILYGFVKTPTADPSAQLELQRLQEEVARQRRIYNLFLEQSRGTQIEEAVQHSDAEFKYNVVEPARPPLLAVGGSKRNFVMVVFLASLGVGVALVIGLEFLDQSIRTVEDIEQQMQLPVWGIIPKISAPFNVWHENLKKSTKMPHFAPTSASAPPDANANESWIP
jgi:uncharacterized protein involved in exopolysaccharide biosynthesis